MSPAGRIKADLIGDDWGNPSSSYRFGSRLKSVVESARENIAELLGVAVCLCPSTPRSFTIACFIAIHMSR
ncbi:MAG: hypothetical protein KA004_13085 [Verrucomicrobiales bacterium]|nr:hypothetical protein [Verrucomicrobiales bacterium]